MLITAAIGGCLLIVAGLVLARLERRKEMRVERRRGEKGTNEMKYLLLLLLGFAIGALTGRRIEAHKRGDVSVTREGDVMTFTGLSPDGRDAWSCSRIAKDGR